ncbi:ABA4-like family protein [Nocardioides sp. WS12]|uniref:ABA4-like family protein n=1 Tax=Nocardioides sp. WS12 TaxID=2486272 RepID=UPI0015F7E03B|nr:ABA4-like family protein [Nocardioides sp. WS12]
MTETARPTTPLEPMPASRRHAYTAINSSSAPLFLAMILLPRSALTRRLVELAMPLHATIGVTYAAFLGSGLLKTRTFLDFRDPDQLRRVLAEHDVFLAGWAHYISFDLFVGQWIWRDAIAAGRSPRLALLLTWLAGPIGLTLYLAQRTFGARREGRDL